MTQIIHPPYRDDAKGPFPFADRSTLLSETGMSLDPELFIDAMLYPPLNSDPLYLSGIAVTETTITYQVSGLFWAALVCGVTVAFDAIVVELFDPDGRHAGLMLIDPSRLAQFRTWTLGSHTFTTDAATFVATCVSPEKRLGVTGLADTAGNSESGDVWLVGERGVTLTVVSDVVYVHVTGDPLWRRRICNGSSAFADTRFLKTINDIPPDEFGGWTLGVGTKLNRNTVVRVQVEGSGIVLSVAGGK